MDHYFIHNPNLKSQPFIIDISIKSIRFKVLSDNGVFAKNGLDFATKLLLENLQVENNKSILDMGCGYGAIGIYLALKYQSTKIIMADVNQLAVELAGQSCLLNKVDAKVIQSNFFENIKQKFDYIISNPPIRIGKKALYEFYATAYKHLNDLGSLWLVIGKKHGAESTINYLKNIYDRLIIVKKTKGFFVIKALRERLEINL